VLGMSRTLPPEEIYEHAGYYHIYGDLTLPHDIAAYLSSYDFDILINCAGVASMNHSMITPIETIEKIYVVNTISAMVLAREAAKKMMFKKWGRIINFSTCAVPMDLAGESAYASSKAAVESLTRILAREYADYGITVNCIGPNPIHTDLIKNVPAEKIGAVLDRQAISRLASFADVLNVCDFYISDRSEMITGQTIYLGGVF
jgi:3-oxoacyl-[acyl-carrier protein] reductase